MLFDHAWQSSLVAIAVAVLTLLFRDHSARIRYWLWFAASLKFLLPFSLLAVLGRMAFVQTVPAQSMAVLATMRPVAMPFSVMAPAPEHFAWTSLPLAIWLLGSAVVAAVWLWRWRRLSAVARRAPALRFDIPVAVVSAPSLLEPGLVGIRRPIILFPKGIMNCLSRAEIEVILDHELCHLRRRDNLLALVHMLVECIFWFHPLVWFIGARLIEERERACDEDVIAGGKKPLDYARTILKVCHLYLRSPLPCASGISGADLDRRISAIMAHHDILETDRARKALLAGVALLTLLIPFGMGGLKSMPVSDLVQSLASSFVAAAPKMETVTTEPPVASPRRGHMVRRLPHESKQIAAIQQTMLAAPTIEPVSPVILVMAPEIGAEPAPAEAVVCRAPQQLPGSHLSGAKVCLPQQEWDRLKQQNLVLMPDGRTVARLEEGQAMKARPCYTAGSNTATSITPYPINCF